MSEVTELFTPGLGCANNVTVDIVQDKIQENLRNMGLIPGGPVAVTPPLGGLSVEGRRKILDDLLDKLKVEPAEELIKLAMATRMNNE